MFCPWCGRSFNKIRRHSDGSYWSAYANIVKGFCRKKCIVGYIESKDNDYNFKNSVKRYRKPNIKVN